MFAANTADESVLAQCQKGPLYPDRHPPSREHHSRPVHGHALKSLILVPKEVRGGRTGWKITDYVTNMGLNDFVIWA